MSKPEILYYMTVSLMCYLFVECYLFIFFKWGFYVLISSRFFRLSALVIQLWSYEAVNVFVLCPKGIYVTRITPGGPAQDAGLKMGDKIMQVCSEIELWSRSTRWHHVYTRESDRSCTKGGTECEKMDTAFLKPNHFLPLRLTAGIWPWWPTTRLVKD